MATGAEDVELGSPVSSLHEDAPSAASTASRSLSGKLAQAKAAEMEERETAAEEPIGNGMPEASVTTGANAGVEHIPAQVRIPSKGCTSQADENLMEHVVDRVIDERIMNLLVQGLSQNRFCQGLQEDDFHTIVASMVCFKFKENDIVMRQNDPGHFFFVVEEGSVEMSVGGKSQGINGACSSFGGIAILYKAGRSATVVAKGTCFIWGVDADTFRSVIREHSKKNHLENWAVLDKMAIFGGLPCKMREHLAEVQLLTEVYEAGATVLVEGSQPAAVYVVKSGKLRLDGAGKPAKLSLDKCVGWRAVLYGEPQRYNVVVEERCELVGLSVTKLKEVCGDDLASYLKQSLAFWYLRQGTCALSVLPEEQLHKVAESMEARNYDPGQPIEDDFTLVVVLDGSIEGKRCDQEVVLGRGEWCGSKAMGLLEEKVSETKAPCTHTLPVGAVAGPSGCRLAALSAEALRKGLQELNLSVGEDVDAATSYLLKVLLLRKVRLFRELSLTQIDALVNACTLQSYQQGSTVMGEDDLKGSFHMLVSGEADVYVNGELKKKLSAGACFGERALLLHDRRGATVQVSSPVAEFWQLAEEAFREAISEDMRKHLEVMCGVQHTKVASLKSLKHVRLIGRGGFGSVRMVEHKLTGVKYALKRVAKEDGRVPEFVERETEILAQNAHPFMLHYVGTFQSGKSVYILTELVTGGQLYQQVVSRMGLLGRKPAQFYIGSIVLILEALHERGIIYRDLKPENVMLDEQGYVKLVDFGLAKKLDASGRTYTFAGTAAYMAPEIIQSTGHGLECDIWSLGVMLFELVCGCLPFGQDVDDQDVVFLSICESELEFPGAYNDLAGKKLLQALLHKQPHQRLGAGARGWAEIKEHKFFKLGSGDLFSKIRGRELKAPWVPEEHEFSDERVLLKEVSLSDSEELGEDEAADYGCKLLTSFKSFDSNRDGIIDKAELLALLTFLEPDTFDNATVDDLLEQIDLNKDGKIQYDEFVAWLFSETASNLHQNFRRVTKLDVHA
mmetsp:Transcript_47956/g.113994  ORF Transcript_47956/g.113994 Transcript_47956/m.113994 type:complete len:1016 (-) Transcript_47956:174-3221(-)